MASVPPDVFFATIANLNERLQKQEFRPSDLARAFGERLRTLGPRYNALALPLLDSAVKRGKDVDDDMKRERYRGPLQGIPFGAKDLLSLAKEPTTWGAKPYAGQVFDITATVLQKLDKIGCLLIGKLAMIELAGGPTYGSPSASLTGPGLNPWDPSRWSGGSSSGSAIAVAAGLVSFALASETNGSIIAPSAFCGVTGLRPTYGLVSRYGAMPLSWTLDKIGPIARSAEDCGFVLQGIAGSDSRDASSAGKSFYYFPNYQRPIKEIRVGFAPADFSPAYFAQALEVFRSLRIPLKEVKLPGLPFGAIVSTILCADAASVFETLISSGKVEELADLRQIAGLKAGLDLPATAYLRAMRLREIVKEKMHELFVDVDVLVAPATYSIAPKVSEPLVQHRELVGRPAGERGLAGLTPAGNLAGLPALCLPCGLSEGMPMAIQLVGLPFSENLLLHLGKAFQDATDWHKRRPPVIAQSLRLNTGALS